MSSAETRRTDRCAEHIVLVRAPAGHDRAIDALRLAQAWLEGGRCVLAFFHGDGVDHAAMDIRCQWQALAAAHHSLDLAICSAAWQRRLIDKQPPAPFELSSLVQFWYRASLGRALCCIGGP
ncbi:MAG: hypothetical protein HND55_11230 [Pseudomonadota bacterium]|nr:MAG: hypothetical protein HND55_11230 [Pseudomonadota bacterium]